MGEIRLQPGDAIGDYVAQSMLGEGGMGVVVQAKHQTSGEQVAIKLLRAEQATDEQSRKRFMREAEAATAIRHPNVAKVFARGVHEGQPYMVVELLEGETLSNILQARAPLPIDEAVDFLLQICDGLAAAHALGVVHRDLKPSNLFVCGEPEGWRVKILDFGISKLTRRLGEPRRPLTALTGSGLMLGTPLYMPPEQVRDAGSVDPRADIWALGTILFKMLTGRHAFAAPTIGQHFSKIFSEPPTRLSELRPDAPAELEAIVERCLAKEPADRFQSVDALADALTGRAPVSAPPNRARRGPPSLEPLTTSRPVDAAEQTWVDGAPEPAVAAPPPHVSLWTEHGRAFSAAATLGLGLAAATAAILGGASTDVPVSSAHLVVAPDPAVVDELRLEAAHRLFEDKHAGWAYDLVVKIGDRSPLSKDRRFRKIVHQWAYCHVHYFSKKARGVPYQRAFLNRVIASPVVVDADREMAMRRAIELLEIERSGDE